MYTKKFFIKCPTFQKSGKIYCIVIFQRIRVLMRILIVVRPHIADIPDIPMFPTYMVIERVKKTLAVITFFLRIEIFKLKE